MLTTPIITGLEKSNLNSLEPTVQARESTSPVWEATTEGLSRVLTIIILVKFVRAGKQKLSAVS
jgi:hypothetical protein